MHLQLLRNATLKLKYAGHTILIDPYFAPKHSLPPYAGRSPNPLAELPASTDEILDGVELVIVSHLHSDHFDAVAQALVPKHLPIICQPGDEATISGAGFADVAPLLDTTIWHGVTLIRREGSHGLGPVVDKMGSVMGFSIEATGEPGVYWAGDTVLYPPVANTISETRPAVIITHSCGARWPRRPSPSARHHPIPSSSLPTWKHSIMRPSAGKISATPPRLGAFRPRDC